MIYLVHYNYDYDESLRSGRDLHAVLGHIRETFEVEVEICDKEFAQEVDLSYEGGNWKGFTLHALDPETAAVIPIDLKAASAAAASNHAKIEFEGKLRANFDKIRKKS